MYLNLIHYTKRLVCVCYVKTNVTVSFDSHLTPRREQTSDDYELIFWFRIKYCDWDIIRCEIFDPDKCIYITVYNVCQCESRTQFLIFLQKVFKIIAKFNSESIYHFNAGSNNEFIASARFIQVGVGYDGTYEKNNKSVRCAIPIRDTSPGQLLWERAITWLPKNNINDINAINYEFINYLWASFSFNSHEEYIVNMILMLGFAHLFVFKMTAKIVKNNELRVTCIFQKFCCFKFALFYISKRPSLCWIHFSSRNRIHVRIWHAQCEPMHRSQKNNVYWSGKRWHRIKSEWEEFEE